MARLDVGAGLNAAVNGGLAAERVVRSGWARLLRTRINSDLSPTAGTDAETGIVAPAARPVRSDAWTPRIVGSELRQPDSTTCGPSSLVMARLINNRSYRDTFVDDGGTVDAAAFGDEVKTMRRMLCRPFDHSGRPQPPWIPALGTGPWAAARAMSGTGGAGRNGALYRVLPFDPLRPADALAMVLRAVHNTEVVPLFVGSPAMARHVVLLTGATSPDSNGSDSDSRGAGAGAEGRGSDGPSSDGPGSDGPGSDGPSSDGPGSDGSRSDGPGSDRPGSDGPGSDGPGSSDPNTNAHLDYYDPADGQWHTLSCAALLAQNAVVAGWREPWFAVVPARFGT